MATNKEIIQFTAKGLKPLRRDIKKLEKQVRQLDSAYRKSTKSSKGVTTGLGAMIAKLGLGYLAFRALTGAITSSIRVAKDFEKEISNVAAISGATGEQLKALEANAKELGRTTVFTASNVATLSTEFAKLGFSSKEITGVTKDTLALAAATQSDLGTAAAVAGQTLRAFGLDVNETSRVTDTMALSFSSSALDMDKFTNSMQYVAPVAKQVGLNVESTTAMLGAMANAGISGSMAGTSLRKILLELGDENSKLTKRIGFSVKTSDDMVKAFKQLSKEGLTTAEMKDMVGQRAISAFGILLDGVGTVDDLTESLKNSGGAAQDMADIQLDNLSGKTTLLKSAMEGLGITIFEHLAEPLSGTVENITSLVGAMNDYLRIPVSAKLMEERDEFNVLLGILTDVNTSQDTRNKAIKELQINYPDYIGNIDLESASQAQLKDLLRQTNEEFMRGIELEAKREILAKQRKETIKIQKEIFLLEKSIREEEQKQGKTVSFTMMGPLFALNNELKIQKDRLVAAKEENQKFMESLGESKMEIDENTGAIIRFGDKATGVFKDLAEGAGDDGGSVPGDITPEMSREQLAVYQQYLSQRATLFGEDTEMQLEMVDDQTNKLLELFQQQGMDINDVLEFYGKKREQILLAEQTAMLGHYSQMASGFASFLGEFAGSQKAAARLQQVAAAIDAYATANALMADPKLVALYPANLIAASAALASGLANVMQISKSIGEFTTAATGFEGIVDRPTMFMTGEGGKREHVSVTPLEAPNLHGPQGGQPITVNISAPLVDETVIDHILPAIENAKRFDLA